MWVFVSVVNWQIRAAVRKTSPRAISLKWRSSRPLAAKTNITSAAIVRMRASTSMVCSAPDVGAVALLLRLELVDIGLRVLARQRLVLRHDVDEGVPDAVAHRLRAAD